MMLLRQCAKYLVCKKFTIIATQDTEHTEAGGLFFHSVYSVYSVSSVAEMIF